MSDIETPTGSPVAAETPATAVTPAAADAAAAAERATRKIREGVVASSKMQKTIIVEIVDRVRDKRYSKTLQRTTRLHVHDEENSAKVGDKVKVMETRPLSKTKRWRLVEVVERAR